MMKYIAVLDLGTTGIRVLVAKITESGATHIIAKSSVACRGVRKFRIENSAEITEAVRKVIRRIREQTDIIVNSVYVSLFGSYVGYIKNTASVEIDGEDGLVTSLHIATLLDKVESVELYENEFLVGAVPMRYVIDNSIPAASPLGMPAHTLRVDAQVLTADIDFVNDVTAALKAAGVEVDGFIPLSVAMRGLLPENDTDQSTLLIDIGGSETEFCVYFKKSIYYASAIPVGGDNITNDVAQVLNVRKEEAEGLKRDYCIADTELVTNNVDVAIFSLSTNQQELIKVHDVVEVMQARIEDILKLIRDKLDAEEIQTDLIDRIIFTGDGITGFSGLNEVCRRILGTKQANVDFSRYTGMKSAYTYASGMVMHVSSMLPYGMKQSAIEKIQAQPEPVKTKGKGVFTSLQDKFKDLVDRLRD